jgi:hypothetical protein
MFQSVADHVQKNLFVNILETLPIRGGSEKDMNHIGSNPKSK